ncbi:MAG: dienelactone hydrolase family protein [Actinomycetota bacterium]|nr:dienelactone hydrolase family protein [Actinomycetota bacterium]
MTEHGATERTDPLEGFTKGTFTDEGKTRDVYRLGQGPAVVVIAEIPGVTPGVLDFARRVADLGCTAVVPVLFGTAGKAISVPYALQTLSYGCVSREFTTMAERRTSPVTGWLRALARHEHEECGGPGVGVVGMCFTGGFALAMMVDDAVLAPVLSQPSLPFPVGKRRKADLGISDADLARVKERCADDGICVLGLRFTGDRVVPQERFDRLRAELGDAFVAVEIDSSKGNPHGIRPGAHSVLTEDLVDEPGHPTRDALHKVLDLFRERLLTSG